MKFRLGTIVKLTLFSFILYPVLARVLSLSPQSVSSQARVFDPQLYSALKWRLIGPFRGGRVLAVAGVSNRPNTYYFGGVAGGVWRTTDAGRVWKPVFDQVPTGSIGAIAVAGSNPDVMYVGAGEADLRSDITYGDGVYKSADGGTTWERLGLAQTQQIGRILVDPHNPDIVLVAALGHPFGPNPDRGVFRSTNGGMSWQKVLYKDDDTGAIDLAADPDHFQTIFATLWHARRPPWSTYPPLGGPGSGIYKSNDGGVTWHAIVGRGLPTENLGRIGVAVAAGTGGRRVYAIVDAEKQGGLYRSDNDGDNWTLVGTDARIHGRGWYFGTVFTDPKNPDTVYVPNVSLYRSTDAGKTFTAIKGAPGGDDYHFLWIDPADPQRMILGCDQGASISVDNGETWTTWNNQPTGQFYHVTTDNQFPYRVYGSQQDSGTAAVASRSDYGRITFRDWYSIGGGESGYIAPDPTDSNIVYGGDTYGDLYRFDRRTGQAQKISAWPESAFMKVINQRKYRFTWTSPIIFSPQDPHVLYMGSQFLLRTADQGNSWQQISPDLTGVKAEPQSRAPLSVENARERGYGVIYTIAPSPLSAGMIWVGTDDGLIQLTRDAGKTWTNVTPPEISKWGKISLIEASHFDAGTAYAAVDRHRLDDYRPYIFRTHDYGKTWQQVSAGIDAEAYVRAVREDVKTRGLLFAGTEKGVYVSFDDGDHWQSLQLNLPNSPVHDLVVKDNDLVVATHGRAFWILDDIEPLRELNTQIAASNAYLFKPSEAIRLRRDVSRDTPLPPEIPAGDNPPAGAVIDYYLKSPVPEKPALAIYEHDGKLVRSFTTDAPAPGTERPPALAGLWLQPPVKLSNNAGLNRFVWDLRYPPPDVLEHSFDTYGIPGRTEGEPLGPFVLPGEYEIRLKIGDKVLRQELTVKLDPRIHVSEADLAAQLKLDEDVGHTLGEATRLQRQMNSLRSQLQSAKSRSAGEPTVLSNRISVLEHRLDDIVSNKKETDFVDTVHTLSGLSTSLEAADAAPTQQDIAVFSEACKRIGKAESDWSQLQPDVDNVNKQLRSAGSPEINPNIEEPQ